MKKLVGILSVVVVAAIVIFYFNSQKSNNVEPPKDPLVRQALEMDTKHLEDSGTSAPEKAKSLVRLASQKNPLAKKKIQDYWDSENETLMAAAIEAAGYLEATEYNDIIETALNSQSEVLEISALKALSRHPSKANETLILNYIKEESNRIKKPFILALKSLYLSATSKEVKSYALDQLLLVASSESSEQMDQALLYLIKYTPNNAKTIKLAKSSWKRSTNAEAWTKSLQLLNSRDNNWVKENLSSLPLADNYKYIKVLVDTINGDCSLYSEQLKGKLGSNETYNKSHKDSITCE